MLLQLMHTNRTEDRKMRPAFRNGQEFGVPRSLGFHTLLLSGNVVL